MDKMQIIRIRVALWSALAMLAAWIVYQAIVPSGKASYYSDFNEDDYFIGRFSPVERLGTSSEGVLIVGEPAYLNLRTTRSFDRAKAIIRYKRTDPTVAPIIEFGGLADRTVKNYDLRPVDNQLLEWLANAWQVERSGNTALYQRPADEKASTSKIYGSVADFKAAPPARSRIALYGTKLEQPYRLPDYASSSQERQINSKPVRGNFQMIAYIKDEPLYIRLSFADLNQNQDRDDISITAYDVDGRVVFEKKLADSEEQKPDVVEDRGQHEISIADLPESYYKIDVKANNDIVAKKIITRQAKVVFANRLWLAGDNDLRARLWTDVPVVYAQTTNPAKLQKIKIGRQVLDLAETFKQFSLKTGVSSTTIGLDKDDVVLAGEGVFAFRESDFFDPLPRKLSASLDLKAAGIDYVFAGFDSPQKDGEWTKAVVDIDLTKLVRYRGQYGFMLSMPGLAGGTDGVIVKDIAFDLSGKTLWQKLFD